MADESLQRQLSAETRTKLRSSQMLTSLSTIISELLQNSIDAGASQIDIGVDCAEWSCWVADNGSGFTKDGLHKIGQDSEGGRYNSSKAYTLASLGTISTFGFRGEALASMADLSCLEISSLTARSRESWSIIVKAGKSLYSGPSIRWRRESHGTVVSIRDAFFNLPVRRQSHPTPNKTIESIRQELEVFALVFPDISFSFQDASKTKERRNPRKSHILKIPKTRSTLAAFRHLYGGAFTEESSVEEIATTSGQLQIEGFISLVGAYTKSYQFLYINKHPISVCDLHRLIDNRFATSTFAKHAYDERGETSLRPSVRRSPRKGEKKPVYVLNLIIPVKHIDNCLEPTKSMIELDNKNIVNSFLSATIQSFLCHHSFAPDKTRNQDAEDGNVRKKRKLAQKSPANLTLSLDSVQPERSGGPDVIVHTMPVTDTQKAVWKDPSTGETFVIDSRTGNSYSQSIHFTGTDGPIEASSKRQTLRTLQPTVEGNGRNKNSTDGDHIPEWLQEALEVNDAFALKEPKIPPLALLTNQDTDYHSSQLRHSCHMVAGRVIPNWALQLGSSNFAASQIRFWKDDLRKARVICQVDVKFIACVVDLDRDDPSDVEKDNDICEDDLLVDGKLLILIDQHAADERVRVERFLKSICRGFLSHWEGSGGVETKQLSPPVPVLLTRQEAFRLVERSDFRKAFESWGFRFSGLDEIQSRLDCEAEPDGGYIQVFVSAIPEIVSEKLLLGKEMQELIKGYIGSLESREPEPREPSSQLDSGDSDEATQWLKALRWCPRDLLNLINSKACRGAIMFNDPLNSEQCERLVKQLSATVFPFQCAHGRPSLVPLMRLMTKSEGCRATGIKWDKVAVL